MVKRILALLTTLALVLGCAAAETAPEADETHQIETKDVPFYGPEGKKASSGFPLYFLDGAADLAYVNLEDWAGLMQSFFAEGNPKYSGYALTCEVNEAEKTVLMTRENGHVLLADFETGTFLWDDYIGFLQGTSGPYIDLSQLPETDTEGRPVYLSVAGTRERHGTGTLLALRENGIPMIAQDGKYLVPLQTMSAFFLTFNYMGFYFNQECLILYPVPQMENIKARMLDNLYNMGLITPDMMAEAENYASGEERREFYLNAVGQTEMGQAAIAQLETAWDASAYKLYAATSPKGERSEAMTLYSFNELCLELDFFYGLKDAHNIENFAIYLNQTGLTDALLNQDAASADAAIQDLTAYWLDDGHSGWKSHSYLIDPEAPESLRMGIEYNSRIDGMQKRAQIRMQYPEAAQPYYEVGDTAYVTMDRFYMDTSLDYYDLAEKGELPNPAQDSISLLYYANQQIIREDSPIRNVVIDLSINGGGAVPTAMYLLGWFLGEAQMSVSYVATSAEITTTYLADVNLDHQFDANDTLAGRNLNLYCLTSPSSFSCANLVPWAFKADGRVTLLGRVTGGGSCSVNYLTTAWGTSYSLSGPMRISFVKNGAYYDVDKGAEPDYLIRDYNNFYNREALTEFIKGLY